MGKAAPTPSPLVAIEEVDDGCANGHSSDQAEAVHDWSMAGALMRLALHAA
jgi:hypothetical protein